MRPSRAITCRADLTPSARVKLPPIRTFEVWSPSGMPVWIVTSVLTGLLLATYVARPETDNAAQPADAPRGDRGVLGMIATGLAWFAVGCPVCNNIALLALGYSGALTYVAPMQPWLAALAVALLLYALVRRLAGQVVCPLPAGRA